MSTKIPTRLKNIHRRKGKSRTPQQPTDTNIVPSILSIDDIKMEKIKRDPNKFREYVIKNDRGGFLKQEAIHKSWVDHIEYCRKNKKHCAILAPWGFGKSVQVAIAETLRIVGSNPNVRIKIVNAIDQYAVDRVKTLRNYIEHSLEYQSVYKEVITFDPTTNEKIAKKLIEKGEGDWSAHRIYVKRESMSIDPTIEARGITSTGISGRADVIIFDDPIDIDSVTSEKARAEARLSYRNVWMSRLVDTGFVMYICTRWHDEDLTKEIIDSEQYSTLIQRISDDFKSIEQERICGRVSEELAPLPECSFFNSDALKKRRNEIGEQAYNRGFRQSGTTQDDLLFKNFKSKIIRGIPIPKPVRCYTGVDLSSATRAGNVIVTVGTNEDASKKWVVDVRRKKWSSPEVAEQIKEVYEKFNPIIVMVENNAYQGAIIEWMTTKGYSGIPIQAFTTGKQKSDALIGLPSLDVQFERGMWQFYVPDHELGCQCPWCQFVREMSQYPVGITSDCVMGFWFAERASSIYGHRTGQAFPEDQMTTSRSTNMKGINSKRW